MQSRCYNAQRRQEEKKKKVYEWPVSLAVNGMQLIVRDESSHFTAVWSTKAECVVIQYLACLLST